MKILQEGIGELLQPPDVNGFREWNRKKSKSLIDKRMNDAEVVRRFIHEGDFIGTELYGSVRCPMSIVNEIIRQDIKNLRLVGQGVYESDVLLAAGLIKEIDYTYIGLELYGISHVIRREIDAGRVEKIVEWSNGALVWRFKAAAMVGPFIPGRSMLGTDTFKYSAAKLVECPYTGDPIALVPALILDVGIIHVHRADKYGNCQIDGITGFAYEMSRACKTLIISAEEIVSTDVIRRQPDRTIIPYYLVDAVVHAPFGSHPGEMCYHYERDEEHIQLWAEVSKKPETTQEYLEKYIYNLKDHQEYLDLIGEERLQYLQDIVPSRG
ncbi:MAG: CoA transferase subunit A [Chloroflexi bacterium]|nr:CoA transferase subunit A [Chloroflexota bacterium]